MLAYRSGTTARPHIHPFTPRPPGQPPCRRPRCPPTPWPSYTNVQLAVAILAPVALPRYRLLPLAPKFALSPLVHAPPSPLTPMCSSSPPGKSTRVRISAPSSRLSFSAFIFSLGVAVTITVTASQKRLAVTAICLRFFPRGCSNADVPVVTLACYLVSTRRHSIGRGAGVNLMQLHSCPGTGYTYRRLAGEGPWGGAQGVQHPFNPPHQGMKVSVITALQLSLPHTTTEYLMAP